MLVLATVSATPYELFGLILKANRQSVVEMEPSRCQKDFCEFIIYFTITMDFSNCKHIEDNKFCTREDKLWFKVEALENKLGEIRCSWGALSKELKAYQDKLKLD